MAKVKVLKENELIGGTDNSSVYPITHTKAVFNSDNKELDQILTELEQQIASSSLSNFVLDLGLVNSQTEGEQIAARSEVAGNRNISFIRFQVQGVRKLKTSLIMQWPNGVDETAQLMCDNKQQWRRNVTGATGVEGDPTNAYPFERTAPHYIFYDAARRIIQLQDYEKREVKKVELPLATSTQDGLMSSSDKEKLDKYPNDPSEISSGSGAKPWTDVVWDAQSNMNKLTNSGEYYIHGQRTFDTDNLPIINVGSGHTFDARLTVLDSSLPNLPNNPSKNTDACVTQVLRMSNRTGGDGHIWIRTAQGSTKSSLTWNTWEKLQGIFEKNNVTTLENLDGYTTNGMYSGIYSGTSPKDFYTVRFLPGDTFLMITINGYAVGQFGMTPQITQLLYKLPAKTSTSEQNAEIYLRTGSYNKTDKVWVWGTFTKMVTNADLSAHITEFNGFKNKTQESIGELYDVTFPIQLSMGIVPSPANNPTSNSVSLSVTQKSKGAFTPDNLELKKSVNSGTEITIYSGKTASYTYTSNIEGNIERFTSRATKTGRTGASASQVRYICAYAANNSSSISDDLFNTAIKRSVTGVSFNPSITTEKGQYIWIFVPSALSINKITSAGFDVTMLSAVTYTLSNGQYKGTYKAYRTANALGAATWNLFIS